jgi:hypothetical protein
VEEECSVEHGSKQCDWDGCHRWFATWQDQQAHHRLDHFPLNPKETLFIPLTLTSERKALDKLSLSPAEAFSIARTMQEFDK